MDTLIYTLTIEGSDAATLQALTARVAGTPNYSLKIEGDDTRALQALIVLAHVLSHGEPGNNTLDFSDPLVPAALNLLLTNLKNSIWHQSVGADALTQSETLQKQWAEVWQAHYSLQQGINRKTGKEVGP